MISAPLSQPAPFTCPRCGAAMAQLPALCGECGDMIAPPKCAGRSTVVGRIASVFALLIWGAIAFTVAGALFLVVSRFQQMSLSLGVPVFVVALIIIGGLLASASLFLRRTH